VNQDARLLKIQSKKVEDTMLRLSRKRVLVPKSNRTHSLPKKGSLTSLDEFHQTIPICGHLSFASGAFITPTITWKINFRTSYGYNHYLLKIVLAFANRENNKGSTI